jgi:deazaflavin-dependent oxidoreductase (nitroreductase family)
VTEPGYRPLTDTLFNEEHVQRYQETDGQVGYIWNDATVLLLTTTGRKTGQSRTTPLIYASDGDDYLVVASVGGMPKHPAWYLNLQADPDAEIQVKADRIKVRARTATEDEKPRLWQIVTEQWPNYNVYQTRTDRVIPVVVLTPVEVAG